MNIWKIRHAWIAAIVWLMLGSRVAFAAETNPQALLLHLPLTNDFKDQSPQRYEVDTEGAVEIRDGSAWFGVGAKWIEAPHLALNARPFAVALHVRPVGHQHYGLVEQRGGTVGSQHLHLMLRGRLQPYFGFLGHDLMSPVSIPTNQWTHLVFQFDGTRQQIWMNGDLICEGRAPAYAGTSGATRLGRSPRWSNVAAQDFEGGVRDVRIYGRKLSFEEIARLNNPAKTPASSDAPVPLLSSKGNTLTIRGTVGEVYEVEVTGNLDGPWQRLATLTNIAGYAQCPDPDAARPGDRYYRINTR